MPNAVLNKLVEPIRNECKLRNVTVTVRRILDQYFIHFKGGQSYTPPNDWDVYWMDFEQYVAHLLDKYGVNDVILTSKGRCYVVAAIKAISGDK